MLTVRNGNNFDLVGRYDGQDYHFPVGKITAIPDDAARHIFGVGLADKQDVLVRHGWMQHSGQHGDAMKKLNGFSFNVTDELRAGDIIEDTAIEFKPVEIVEPTEKEQGSAPLQMAAEGEADSLEAEQPSVSTYVPMGNGGGSILDRLSGA